MPLESVPETSLQYYLVNFDAKGNERDEADGTKISLEIGDRLAKEPITDVFIFTHGWQGDIPAAKSQYGRWIAAMAANSGDLEKMSRQRSSFQPLLIGWHWPSLPWGDENISTGSAEESIDAVVS
jgi:hypothetical protein